MSDWAPSQNIYVHIVRFLIQSRRQPKSDEVARGMNELIQMPDFNCYLALIFAQGTEDEDTRSLAGLMLKNNLLNNAAAYSPSVRDFVKRTCLPCIGHPTKLFRTTFGMIASSLIINQETGSWPELVASLPSFFQSSNPDELDVSQHI